MKKIVQFIKDNYLFSLFIIPFIAVCIINRTPDNDIWFLLSLGRAVLTNGFVTVEPLTIHEGLSYVMQQWGSAVSFWILYDNLGKFAILFFILGILVLLFMCFYKLTKLLSNNKYIAIIITTCVFTLISSFIVSRPQIITYLILLLELLFLESYVKTNNWKYLIGLIPLSIILINVHAAMWLFLFLFLLPYIVNGIYIKKITIDKYKLMPLLIVTIIMFFVGFINPYGIDNITYVFNSYNLPGLRETIAEMKAVDINHIVSFISFGFLCLLIILDRYVKKFKLDVRHICLIFGTYLLFLSHAKCYPYFVFTYFIAMSYGLKKVKLPKFNLKKYMNLIIVLKSLLRATCLMLFISLFVVLGFMFKYYSFTTFNIFDGDSEIVADYIENNYDLDKVRIFTYFDDGGYYQFRGMKTYIDPRAEVFFKKLNKDEDIFTEYLKIFNDDVYFDYEKFLAKYKFTHLVVFPDTLIDKYLNDCEEYEVVYTVKYQYDENKIYQKLYALKDLDISK